ncbi:Glycerophosphocholine phosphodiesterase [Hamiltosporidium tvaerminnensis]|nr:Glycerophosphocholine phosphodiesterase [Hamiltosporidium tvaerminnensis]
MKFYIFLFLNSFNLISSSISKQNMNEIVELQENVIDNMCITIYCQQYKECKVISSPVDKNIIDIQKVKNFYFRFEIVSKNDCEDILYYEMTLYYKGTNQGFRSQYKKHFEMTILTDYDTDFKIEIVVHRKNECKIYFEKIHLNTNILEHESNGLLNSINDQTVKARFSWFPYYLNNFEPLEYIFPDRFFIGHRGSGTNQLKTEIEFYENTIPAFENAFKKGISWIEFDVQVTSDFIPIVFHDFMIKTNENEFYIGSLKFSEISKICQSKDSGYCNILGLDSLFTILDENIGFNIEIKYPNSEEIEENGIKETPNLILFIKSIFDVVERYPARKMFFSSFHMDTVIFIRLSYPNVILFYLTEGKESISSTNNDNPLEFAHNFCRRYNLKGVIVDSSVLLAFEHHLGRILNDDLLIFTYGSETNYDNTVTRLWESNITAMITDDVENAKNRLT